jgi:hypothetical protein
MIPSSQQHNCSLVFQRGNHSEMGQQLQLPVILSSEADQLSVVWQPLLTRRMTSESVMVIRLHDASDHDPTWSSWSPRHWQPTE